MRILYSYISARTEGSQIHIDSFVEAFEMLGEIVISNGRVDPPYSGDKARWSILRRVRVRLAWIGGNVASLVRVLAMAILNRTDVLIFRFDPLNRFALAILGSSLIRPVILEVNAVRSIEHHEGRPRISDWLDRLSLMRAKKVFAVSEKLRSHLVSHYRIDPRKVQVIENGVDEKLFDFSVESEKLRRALGGDGRFIIGFVGSFRSWHGLTYLIDLAAALVPELPQSLFLLVGDGPDRKLYERMVHEKGLSKNFVFSGFVAHERIPEYLGAMDAVIAPFPISSYEKGFYGSALKIFEYMAMGKPVITSPLGQLVDVIVDGESGLLVPAEDTLRLKATLYSLYLDPEKRKVLGGNARRRVVDRYTWKCNAEKVRQLCLEVSSDSTST